MKSAEEIISWSVVISLLKEVRFVVHVTNFCIKPSWRRRFGYSHYWDKQVACIGNKISNVYPDTVHTVELQTSIQVTIKEMILDTIEVGLRVVPLKTRRRGSREGVNIGEVTSDEIMVCNVATVGANCKIGNQIRVVLPIERFL